MRPRDEITTKMIAKRNLVAVLVANLTGVPVDDIMGNHRHERIAEARQLTMWALVTLCGMTHQQVGILMRRHHSTVTYSVSHIAQGYGGSEIEKMKTEIKNYHKNKRQ